MPQSDMRAYCATEIFKTLIRVGKKVSITREDLRPDDRGEHSFSDHHGLSNHQHSSYCYEDKRHPCGIQTYTVTTNDEERLGRVAVRLADGLLWALKNVKEKKSV